MPHRQDSSRTNQRNRVVSGPAEEPITVAEVKDHARILSADQDALIATYIKACREMIEQFLTRKLVTQEIEAFMDGFPAGGASAWWVGIRQGTPLSTGITGRRSIHLDILPVQAAPAPVISTFNETDTETVFPTSDYRVDSIDPDQKARITLVDGGTWPSDLRNSLAVKIVYTVGYGDAAAVPQDIKQAMLMIVAYWIQQKEAACSVNLSVVPLSHKHLLSQYRQIVGL